MISSRAHHTHKLPILKATFEQGRTIKDLLTVIEDKPIRVVSNVIKEMKPRYVQNYIKRGGVWPSEPVRQQKRIDTEHSYIVEFCKVFDLLSYQDNEVMLTFLGRKLLQVTKEYGVDNIFDSIVSDCFGKIALYVDDKKWCIIKSLENEPDGLTNLSLLRILNKKGIGIDVSSLQRRLKERLRKKFREEWRSKYGERHVDWTWMENKLKKELQHKTNERLKQIMESILKFFRLAGIIIKEEGRWHPDHIRIQNLRNLQYWREINSVNYDDFFQATLLSYRFWTRKIKSSDVPLPLIRNDVCLKLDITWDSFDLLLQNAPSNYESKVFSFSQSRFPKKWGIVKNNRNFYYLSVRTEGNK